MYPGRGVLHTPHKHPARDERIDDESQNDYTASAWPIGGRMQYVPTWVHLHHPSIKYTYPCRSVLHTPHKHPARNERIDHKSPNDCSFSLGMIEGRMQYASTWVYLYHPSIQCVYPCRGVLHTPHNHPTRDERMPLKSKNDCPFLLDIV